MHFMSQTQPESAQPVNRMRIYYTSSRWFSVTALAAILYIYAVVLCAVYDDVPRPKLVLPLSIYHYIIITWGDVQKSNFDSSRAQRPIRATNR